MASAADVKTAASRSPLAGRQHTMHFVHLDIGAGAERFVLGELVAVSDLHRVGAIAVALLFDEFVDASHRSEVGSVYTIRHCQDVHNQGTVMTNKQIEAGLRSKAAWHDTKAERLGHLAYGAKDDAFRKTMLARADEHSKQAVEAMKNASDMMKGDEAAAKKHAQKPKKKGSKKQRTSGARKR